MTLTDHYYEHISGLVSRMNDGDHDATKTIGAIVLLLEGWRPGDPDPSGGDDPGGGELIYFADWKNAA